MIGGRNVGTVLVQTAFELAEVLRGTEVVERDALGGEREGEEERTKKRERRAHAHQTAVRPHRLRRAGRVSPHLSPRA